MPGTVLGGGDKYGDKKSLIPAPKEAEFRLNLKTMFFHIIFHEIPVPYKVNLGIS